MSFVLCANVKADLLISWASSGGFFQIENVATMDPFIADTSTSSYTLQLIWSSDMTYDMAYDDGVDFLTGSDDVLLTTYNYTENGIADDFDAFFVASPSSYQAPFTGGYVYGRLFENATPTVGTRYFDGNMMLLQNVDVSVPGPIPQSYELSRGEYIHPVYDPVVMDAFGGTFGGTVQPVPEPGTMALFALGVATLAASRRRRKVHA